MTIISILFSAIIAIASPVRYQEPIIKPSQTQICVESNPDFIEYRYAEKIPYCRRNVSVALKNKIYSDYGIPNNERKEYTIDHIVPLSIGGTNHYDNLWPEHRDIKNQRYNLELDVFKGIQAGKITQGEAIRLIIDVKYGSIKYPTRLDFDDNEGDN